MSAAIAINLDLEALVQIRPIAMALGDEFDRDWAIQPPIDGAIDSPIPPAPGGSRIS